MKRDSEFTKDSIGGTKKFLYNSETNKKQKGSRFEDEQDQWTYVNANNNKQNNADFDLDDVWSIKKNVTVSISPTQTPRAGADNWSLNVGKNYYSRHGGLSDSNKLGSGLQTSGANTDGKSWSQGKPSYSYSYSSSNVTSPGFSEMNGSRQSNYQGNSIQPNLGQGNSTLERMGHQGNNQFQSSQNSRYLDF